MSRSARVPVVLLLCAVVAAAAMAIPASASAHAVLLSSDPARGVTVDRAPDEVVLRFSEPVEVAFGALRVIGGSGERADDGRSGHPAGRQDELRVGLRPGLNDGRYVATYRVISADSHPVSGGVVFSIGARGAAPANVESLLDAEAGPVTRSALKAARGVAYLATAALLGGLMFFVVVWIPAVRIVGADPAAGVAFTTRLRGMLGWAAAVGVGAAAAGLVLQAALAGATTVWAALDPATLRELLETNFGQAWGLRLLAFAGLGGLVVRAGTDLPVTRGRGALVALGAAVLVFAPGLSGHARATSPVSFNVMVDAVHVAAMSAWLGGLIVLLAAVPAATRVLAPEVRTHLLAAVLHRFSPIALLSVVVLVITGTVASVVHLTALSELVDSDWGLLVLAKIVLLSGLVGAGAVHRRRTMPRLRALVAGAAPPGADGRVLRSTLRAEVALGVGVLAVTAVLVGISPPASGAGGPVSVERRLGPLRLQATIDPGRAGVNELHLYLLRADGQPFSGTKELKIAAELPAEDIGPVPVDARNAGPGHYVAEAIPLTPGGDWELTLAVRVSEFDQYDTRLAVPVR